MRENTVQELSGNNIPFISITMLVRNEDESIKRAARSALNNDCPTDKVEVLVVDGMSDNGKRGTWAKE